MVDATKGAASRRESRRQLLGFLLGSPLIGSTAALSAWWPGVAAARPERAVPERASQALDVFQVKAAAQRRLDLAAWHFIVNGADDGKTMAANREAFDDWQIRARRLIDVSRVDMGVEVFGQRLPSPILLAPCGGQQRIHEQGELAVARAAARRGHLAICATISSYSLAEIRAQTKSPLWFQLYASRHRDFMKYLIGEAERAGCMVLVLTVDGPTIGNREGERWFRTREPRSAARMGNFEGYDGKKGIVTREDAALCVEHGVDGVVVSNHGGRQEESGRGTLECLPEVLDGVDGRLPVLIDGGFRRGTDIFKALGLGARAVCIGRPYLWGLGAFGEDGVARVLALLDAELERIMKFAGTVDIPSIGPGSLLRG